MKSLHVICFSLGFYCIIGASTWTGHVCKRMTKHFKYQRYCAKKLWTWCLYHSTRKIEYYGTLKTCCPGWTHNGDQNCNKKLSRYYYYYYYYYYQTTTGDIKTTFKYQTTTEDMETTSSVQSNFQRFTTSSTKSTPYFKLPPTRTVKSGESSISASPKVITTENPILETSTVKATPTTTHEFITTELYTTESPSKDILPETTPWKTPTTHSTTSTPLLKTTSSTSKLKEVITKEEAAISSNLPRTSTEEMMTSSTLPAMESENSTHASAEDNGSFSCPKLFGYFADKTNCTNYYYCNWSVEHAFSCPTGTHWNQTLLNCDHGDNC